MSAKSAAGERLKRAGFGAAGLLVLSLAVYLPALGNGFIWDDDFYVTHNRALSAPGGLAQIWLNPAATPQYYPLTHTTFWLEYRLWGLRPAGYHLVNVLLHGISVLLLWRILRALCVPGAWIGAALFAVHPVHVESVTWITERKNTLSAVFALAAVFLYLRVPLRRWAVAALFACALLSKTVTASVPVCLGLLSYWKEGRLSRRQLALLAPLLTVGGAFGLLTAWLETHHVGAQGADWSLRWSERLLLAGKIFWFYPAKLVWPARLNFVYPRWDPSRFGSGALFAAASVALLFLALWLLRDRLGRGPVIAAAIYLVTLAPALGFINVYPMRYSFVADHFQYLASIPLLALAGALLFHAGVRATRSRAVWLPAVVALALLAPLTWTRNRVFHDEETLWRETLTHNPSAWIAWENLGNILARRGEYEEALRHYRETLRLQPERAETYHNQGLAYEGLKDLPAAENAYRRALLLRPELRDARNNLAIVLYFAGRYPESWQEVHEFQRQGGTPHHDFLRNLAAKMPEP